MTRVTDEMVEAALDIWTDRSWRTSGGAITALMYGQRMRVALEAALAVAPTAQDDWMAEHNRERLQRYEMLYEQLARSECRRQGIDPDDIIADGGHMAWHLVGYEAAMKHKTVTIAPKDEASERKSAFDAAEASAWPELEWPGERGSRMIVYDGVNVIVPVRDIRQAIAELSNGDRQHTVMLARGDIEKTLPAVRQGTASQYAAMMCARDVAIWFANEIIEGREILEMNQT